MTHKRRAPRPDPAAQDPMDYLLDDVTGAVDKVAAELQSMADLKENALGMPELAADPISAIVTLAGHCANLAGRVAALVEVVRQMRDQQRGLVVISDPPIPAPVLMTDDQLAAAQRGQAERTLVRWRMGSDGHLEPVYADQNLATDEQMRDGRVDLLQSAIVSSVMAGPTEAQLAARQAWLAAQARGSALPDLPPVGKMTHAEALVEAERLGGIGGAMFLLHWAGAHGGQ